MDRISKAVERARKERENKQGRSGSETKDSAQVSYTRTRSVSLDRRVLARNHIILEDSIPEFSHAFKVLRTQIWRLMKDNGWNSLAVTSCTPDEGKTLVSINLSISLAMMKANHSVLLVDMDLRRPSIHERFGLDIEQGINDYLENGVALEEILINPGLGRFVILPGRESVKQSSEVLSSARMERMVQEFKSRYPSRIVVYDLPPVLSTDDVLVFSPYVDAVLLVVAEGQTTTEELRRAVNMLKGTNLIGTVLNKSEEILTVGY